MPITVKHPLRQHVFVKFFLRLFLVLVAMTLLGSSGVYYYFERQNARELNTHIEQIQEQFTRHFRTDDLRDPKQHDRLSRLARKTAQANNVTRFKLCDASGHALLDYEASPLPPALNLTFKKLFATADEPLSYLMLPTGDDQATLVFAKRIVSDDGKEAYQLKIAMPLSPEKVERMRVTMRRVILFASLTLLLVIAVIFPLVYLQYRQLEQDKINLLHSNMGTIRALGSAVALRDSDTHTHNYRVTYYSVRLAEAMGLEREYFSALIKGAFLHDVGKIGIPDAVLLKPGRLEADELAVMKTHVTLGLSMIRHTPWLKDAAPIIGNHHEKYDGTGYPKGISGREIPLVARIFAVADVFDALMSKRPYKEPWSIEHSLRLLEEEAGSHFDPAAVAAFVQIAKSEWLLIDQLGEHRLYLLLLETIRPYEELFV